MIWNPRRKSMVFSASLTMLSAGMLTSAALSTESLLDPLEAGFDWATERGLSRNSNSLTLLASSYDQGEIERLAGVVVEIERVAPGGSSIVATGVTASDGRVQFELQNSAAFRGGYWVRIQSSAITRDNPGSSWGTHLEDDVRLGVYITPDAKAFWRSIRHDDLEQRGGDVAVLGVRLSDHDLCEQTEGGGKYCKEVPERSVRVQIFRIERGDRVELVHDDTQPYDSANWARDRRDPGLAPGDYDVVVTYDGKTRTDRVALLCDLYLMHEFDDGFLEPRHPFECGRAISAIGVG